MWRFIVLFVSCASVWGEEVAELSTKEKIDRFSEFIGYTLGNELSKMKLDYSPNGILKGLENFQSGCGPSLQDMGGGMGLALHIQEEFFDKKAAENLLLTERFFADLENNSSVIKLVDKELYIEILHHSDCPDIIGEDSEPLVHLFAKTFENILIINTYTGGVPVRIPITETIPGFIKGIHGMRIGEKRRIYVHPNLAYKRGGLVPPNSVLIFEVEAIAI